MTVDLTLDYRNRAAAAQINTRCVHLKSGAVEYTGVVYDVSGDSMNGTYIDFPGHIAETDDGVRANTADLADFFRIPASVIHLDRSARPGAVTAAELREAFGGVPQTPAVIINALGATGCYDIPYRSVFLDLDVADFLAQTPCRLLVSDIYESVVPCGIFLKLFQAGISAVCEPANLHMLTACEVNLSVGFAKMPVTQLSCSLVADF